MVHAHHVTPRTSPTCFDDTTLLQVFLVFFLQLLDYFLAVIGLLHSEDLWSFCSKPCRGTDSCNTVD